MCCCMWRSMEAHWRALTPRSFSFIYSIFITRHYWILFLLPFYIFNVCYFTHCHRKKPTQEIYFWDLTSSLSTCTLILKKLMLACSINSFFCSICERVWFLFHYGHLLVYIFLFTNKVGIKNICILAWGGVSEVLVLIGIYAVHLVPYWHFRFWISSWGLQWHM